MPSQPAGTPHVSQHHLEGSLADTSLDRILESCHRHLVTGLVRVTAGSKVGVIELRAGAVDTSKIGDLTGRPALAEMHKLRDGMYEIVQRLPDLAGELGGSSAAEGDVTGVPLIAIMRHCEDNALTCTITVIGGFDRATLEYRAGEIARIELNGYFDDDALTQVLSWPDARFRVAAPPLDLDVEGWPVTRRAPTVPAHIEVPLAAKRGSSRAGEIVVEAAKPAPKPQPAPAPAKPAPAKPARAPTAIPVPLASPTPPTGPMIITPSRAITLPPLATRYRTGDTQQTRRAPSRLRSSHGAVAVVDVAWMVVAAALLLALGVSSLLFLG